MPGKTEEKTVVITAPNMETAIFDLVGTSPYVTNKFSQEAIEMMKKKQMAGSVGKSKKERKPKDFPACARESQHHLEDGTMGLPANAFRKAMISACRLVGYKMTLAKLSLKVLTNDFGEDGTPLVRVTRGKPHYVEHYVRNETGVCDIRPRMMLDAGWRATVKVEYDADQFSGDDVANLMMRVGHQVGIGAGRNDSTNSAGMGWGFFDLAVKS